MIVLAVLVQSCSTEPVVEKKRPFEGYGMWMDTVLKTQDRVLRGVEPGMSVEEVKKQEMNAPTEEDSSSLYYEMKADSLTDVSFTYQVSGGRVDEIEMEIRTGNQDRGAEIFNDLTKYYQSKYGMPVTEKGIYVYSTQNSAGDPVRVSLEDRSSVDDGLVYIFVYRE
jgi:hypothetical protein